MPCLNNITPLAARRRLSLTSSSLSVFVAPLAITALVSPLMIVVVFCVVPDGSTFKERLMMIVRPYGAGKHVGPSVQGTTASGWVSGGGEKPTLGTHHCIARSRPRPRSSPYE